MAPLDFTSELKQFVAQHIESLLQLEMLLLLRQDPKRRWTADEVAKSLYATPEMCAGLLTGLARGGFLESGSAPELRWHYQPANADLDRLLGELSAIYHERRVAVISLIFSKPVNKVQTFADAFRLRKEE
jgi:hypothetical protein